MTIHIVLVVWQLVGLLFNVGAVIDSTRKKRFYLVAAGAICCGMQVLLLLQGLHALDLAKGVFHG